MLLWCKYLKYLIFYLLKFDYQSFCTKKHKKATKKCKNISLKVDVITNIK